MHQFWLCFVPLLVAVDAVGILPIYMTLTAEMTPQQRRRTLRQSLITAIAVAVGFLFLGQWLFGLLGITVADFMIAGGLLLLVLAINDLVTTGKQRFRVDPDTVGPVPLGVPLMTGPAVLTTVLLLANQHGRWITVLAVVANLLLAGLIFRLSDPLHRWLGTSGTRTISKVVTVILAAFAVMMVRKGVLTVWQQMVMLGR